LVHSQSGVLNILYDGEVKSVGATNFNNESAQTACRELYNVDIVVDIHVGVPCVYDTFWVDNVQCV
jgi:diketogulonate reductase-like aldo/keto reductase